MTSAAAAPPATSFFRYFTSPRAASRHAVSRHAAARNDASHCPRPRRVRRNESAIATRRACPRRAAHRTPRAVERRPANESPPFVTNRHLSPRSAPRIPAPAIAACDAASSGASARM
ncbi:hypothetical protein FG479_26195 [Burkholderia pseudomallei]|nr:hypothetical protein [Burkholderia pseudomallei]NRE50492.1 hypothetical protein [Burkholderia pseudomallei]